MSQVARVIYLGRVFCKNVRKKSESLLFFCVCLEIMVSTLIILQTISCAWEIEWKESEHRRRERFRRPLKCTLIIIIITVNLSASRSSTFTYVYAVIVVYWLYVNKCALIVSVCVLIRFDDGWGTNLFLLFMTRLLFVFKVLCWHIFVLFNLFFIW